ncbi:FHA domain-containing protein [Roseobacter sp. S98]|uniref:FHA domain-containing protein n=1 Tax=Roseobacter algicola (ex Choi et al. 2025) (nom. illeg.) TaxID=3092138 RepID=UPI0035C67CDB
MTLFRKVFQNQSREATSLDAPDEDALREAMQDARSDTSPLGLDPFAVDTHEEPQTDGDEHYDDLIGEPAEPEASADAFAELPAGEPVVKEVRDVDTGEMDRAEPAAFDDVPDAADPEVDADTSEEGSFEPAGDAADEADAGDIDISAMLARARDAAPAVDAEAGAEAAVETDPGDADPVDTVTDTAETAAPAQIDLSAFAREQLSVQSEIPPEMPEAPEAADVPEAPAPAAADLSGLPAPAAGRAGRRAGRVKTRLLGFNRGEPDPADPFGTVNEATAAPQHEKFPVGWLVVVEGPGVGHSFSIFTGASMIGRGEDQMIRLDFGDNSISRQNHAAIAYDEEQNKFYLGHGGKSNIIRRNARPVLATEELHHADLIRIGETTLRFVALCGSDFKWETTDDGHAASF